MPGTTGKSNFITVVSTLTRILTFSIGLAVYIKRTGSSIAKGLSRPPGMFSATLAVTPIELLWPIPGLLILTGALSNLSGKIQESIPGQAHDS